MRRRATAALVGLALTVGVGVLGVAPAAAATQLTVSPASGPPGSAFVVTGTGFATLPVEIRWGGLSGPVIATAMGPAFSVPAVVPESPPNSHPVMAVVTDGSSVSTSSASFQVTTGEAPALVETTTTAVVTSTTVAPPEPSPTASIPPGETGRSPIQSGSPRGGLSGGVDGGVETGTAGTTNGGGAPSASSTGGGGAVSTAASTPATVAAAEAPIPTVTLPVAGTPAPPPTGEVATGAPQLPGDAVAAPALVPRQTSQSAGAVSNPALLFLGLALVFGGGVFLAVRNRHRA